MKGFTLIEVMVVLVIVGVMASLTTLGMGRLQEDPLTRAAGNLSGWLQASSDDAVLYGAVMGAGLDKQSHQLQRYYYSPRGWRALIGDELKPLRLPTGATLWSLDKQQVRQQAMVGFSGREPVPDILFFPTGMSQPERWELSLENTQRTALVSRNADGLYVWSVR